LLYIAHTCLNVWIEWVVAHPCQSAAATAVAAATLAAVAMQIALAV
jgi:hypothetical protein